MSKPRLSRAGGRAGHRFKIPNRYGLPAFCTLHVRAWKANPNGAFVNRHLKVTCDNFSPRNP